MLKADLLRTSGQPPAPYAAQYIDELRQQLEAHRIDAWGNCAALFCPHAQQDRTCGHPNNLTPECHEHACPEHNNPTAAHSLGLLLAASPPCLTGGTEGGPCPSK